MGNRAASRGPDNDDALADSTRCQSTSREPAHNADKKQGPRASRDVGRRLHDAVRVALLLRLAAAIHQCCTWENISIDETLNFLPWSLATLRAAPSPARDSPTFVTARADLPALPRVARGFERCECRQGDTDIGRPRGVSPRRNKWHPGCIMIPAPTRCRDGSHGYI